MPVPSFLASIADKAQSAIHSSGSGAGGDRHHAMTTIQHQLRALGQQYTTTTPVQKIITVEKSVAIDLDSLERDAKSQSKEIYTWGQGEAEDIKDVSDRLAFLNFVQGSLAGSLGSKLDAARAPFKVLRDAETAITPRRNIRAGLQLELSRLEHSQQKGLERKITELKDQIKKAEHDDEAQEKEIELLKRKGLQESEQLKWEAFREYGEKLVLLSQAATPIINALPSSPPTAADPYTGAQNTGAARASLQRALDNYKTGHIFLPPEPSAADLHRSDTRSFGESHASELSSITSNSSTSSASQPAGHTTPPPTEYKPPAQPPAPFRPTETHAASVPIDVANLNQAPVRLPSVLQVASSVPVPLATESSPVPPNSIQASPPTIAETGIPLVASSHGPSSGSIHDLRDQYSRHSPAAPLPGTTGAPLPAEESEGDARKGVPSVSSSTQGVKDVNPPSAPESTKFERLEREEKEHILSNSSDSKKDEDLPPKYQEF